MFIPSIDEGIANQIMKDPYEFDFLTVKETTKSFQVLSGFSFPCIALCHSRECAMFVTLNFHL